MNTINALYEQDYFLWLEETYKLLENNRIEELDFLHLKEEILSLGNEQRRKVDSYLRQLLIHLLLYKYWNSEKEYCAKGCQNEIDNFRFELELLLKSKTLYNLYNYFLQEIEEIYVKARRHAIKKSELPAHLFPESCPFSADDLLDPEFLPD